MAQISPPFGMDISCCILHKKKWYRLLFYNLNLSLLSIPSMDQIFFFLLVTQNARENYFPYSCSASLNVPFWDHQSSAIELLMFVDSLKIFWHFVSQKNLNRFFKGIAELCQSLLRQDHQMVSTFRTFLHLLLNVCPNFCCIAKAYRVVIFRSPFSLCVKLVPFAPIINRVKSLMTVFHCLVKDFPQL